MSTIQVELKDANWKKLVRLSQGTGRSEQELLNLAVEELDIKTSEPEWKLAWRQAAGMWKDRQDIPELMKELRGEWDRRSTGDEPIK